MSNNQIFLNLYNQLDEQLREKLGAKPQRSHASLLETMAGQDPVFKEYHSRLQAYRALRNALIHIPYNGEEPEPIAEPISAIVEQYQKIVDYVLNPPTALQAIAIKEVSTCTWTENFQSTLEVMQLRKFRLMPIVESNGADEVLVGIFDISTLAFHINEKIKSQGSFTIDNRATFELFQDLMSFDLADPDNKNQTVTGVQFVSEQASVEDIEQIFKCCFRDNRLVSVVCITPTGNAFEPLLGIVTAHDLPSANGRVRL